MRPRISFSTEHPGKRVRYSLFTVWCLSVILQLKSRTQAARLSFTYMLVLSLSPENRSWIWEIRKHIWKRKGSHEAYLRHLQYPFHFFLNQAFYTHTCIKQWWKRCHELERSQEDVRGKVGGEKWKVKVCNYIIISKKSVCFIINTCTFDTKLLLFHRKLSLSLILPLF